MIRIKPGEPQPVPCSNCDGKKGYRYGETVKTEMLVEYLVIADGSIVSSNRTDHKINREKGVIPFCLKCGCMMNFQLNHEEGKDDDPGSL